jgi:hypothetical protein
VRFLPVEFRVHGWLTCAAAKHGDSMSWPCHTPLLSRTYKLHPRTSTLHTRSTSEQETTAAELS